MDEIEIVEYNPDWINIFEQEKRSILGILELNLIEGIEHIGSTAVEFENLM